MYCVTTHRAGTAQSSVWFERTPAPPPNRPARRLADVAIARQSSALDTHVLYLLYVLHVDTYFPMQSMTPHHTPDRYSRADCSGAMESTAYADVYLWCSYVAQSGGIPRTDRTGLHSVCTDAESAHCLPVRLVWSTYMCM